MEFCHDNSIGSWIWWAGGSEFKQLNPHLINMSCSVKFTYFNDSYCGFLEFGSLGRRVGLVGGNFQVKFAVCITIKGRRH